MTLVDFIDKYKKKKSVKQLRKTKIKYEVRSDLYRSTDMHVRVCGVLLKDSTILLVKHRKVGEDYWLLPGGRIGVGESSAQALAREFLEELRIEVKVQKLLFVVEAMSGSGDHIIQPTFLVETDSLRSIGLGMDRRVVDFRFFSHTEMEELTIYPDIRNELRDYLISGKTLCKYYYKKWIN